MMTWKFAEIAVVAGMIALAATGRGAAAQTAPVFVPAACPKAADAIRIPLRCSTVMVPENRGDPASRTLHLAVFILGGTDPHPAPDPIVFLTGGPGDGAFGFLAAAAKFSGAAGLFAHRALVTFDPRGVGHSKPRLDCGSLGDTACVARLTAQKVDVQGYTLRENVDDVDTVRRALGARDINLYGISFGSRWAMDVLRQYPRHVRALVLDGPQPPQTLEDGRSAETSAAQIDKLIGACEADTACGAAFPNLLPRYLAGIKALNANPVTVGGQTIAGNAIALNLFAAQYNPRLLGELPQAMNQTAALQVPTLLTSGQSINFINVGSSLPVAELVACGESFRDSDIPGLTRLAQKADTAALVAYGLLRVHAECTLWPHATSPAYQLQPVRSAKPALVFIGEFDPVTPLRYGQIATSTLPNSRIVQFRGRGHTQFSINPCGLEIATAFFDSGTSATVDASCAGALPKPDWVTATH